jgi:peptide deformylase
MTDTINTFEIIPNEQTPKVQEIADIELYLKMHGQYLQEFLENCRWRLNAAGLACNQVSLNGDRFMVRAFGYLNLQDRIWRLAVDPKIDEYIGIKEIKCEGCLTWKGKVIVAERSRAVRVSYYDIHGNKHTDELYKGFDAQIWQHEINHLNGVAERIEEPGFPQPKQIDVGRNDRCPCGSGKKYKQCCLLYL